MVLLFGTVMIGCKDYQTINGDSYPILTGHTLSSIKILLDKANADTSYRLGFSIDYSRNEMYLVDRDNKWELGFSKKYFDIEIKYADANMVFLYCNVSGIMNGLTLFPITHNDLFVIDRKRGKKLLDIQSKEGGITKVVVEDSIVYFEYYEPDIVRYVAIPPGSL